MKQYFAATETDQFLKILYECGAKNILTSYFWLDKKRDFTELKKKGFNIFIDSGGFSARESGKSINIKEYKDFLIKNKNNIDIAANYDVGTLKEQLENQKFLEKDGFPIIPVYHLSEYINNEKRILDYYIEKYSYIALGGMVGKDANEKNITSFLNFCFSKAVSKKIKFHGFGVNNSKRLMQYPWYSIDSSNWIKGAQFGTLSKWEKYTMKSGISYKNKKQVIENEIPIKVTENYFQRLEHDAKEFLKMEKDITDIWTKRGIIWN